MNSILKIVSSVVNPIVYAAKYVTQSIVNTISGILHDDTINNNEILNNNEVQEISQNLDELNEINEYMNGLLLDQTRVRTFIRTNRRQIYKCS